MKKLDGKSLDITNDNIEKIKQLFPNVVTEDKINFEKLRLILGEDIDEGVEKYQFTWPGKSDSIRLAQTPSTKTLRPAIEESKHWSDTKNLYIEGDNLEVLKQLQKTYHSKIDVIYVDPPYNTGRDFVYSDKHAEDIKNYLESSNQELLSNPETDGRYHSNWLNMMYPRLLIARNLLSNNGVIFMSIGEEEFNNLKKISDEIFGEQNYITSFIWQKTSNPNQSRNNLGVSHEYILAYSKMNDFTFNKLPLSKDEISSYTYNDKYIAERGPYKLVSLNKTGTTNDRRPNLEYKIEAPDGSEISPRPRWRWSKEKFEWGLKEERVEFRKNNNGDYSIYYKQYLLEDNDGNKIERGAMISSILSEYGRTTTGTLELKNIFDGNIFDFPKPSKLLEVLINISTNKNSIVLDFFSGSSSTANAVMNLNSKDGGNRKFIMVQLREKTEEKSEAFKKGFKNICEIGKERIRKSGELLISDLTDENNLFHEGHSSSTLDTGFKVFKLDETNIIAWEGIKVENNKIATLLDQLEEVFKEDRTHEDVVYEIMLKYGVFDMTVEEIKINNKPMYDIGIGYMLICLEENINNEDVVAIGNLGYLHVVFNDKSFENDNVKLNAEHTLKNMGVEEVVSI